MSRRHSSSILADTISKQSSLRQPGGLESNLPATRYQASRAALESPPRHNSNVIQVINLEVARTVRNSTKASSSRVAVVFAKMKGRAHNGEELDQALLVSLGPWSVKSAT